MDELTGPYLFDRLAAEQLSDAARFDLDFALAHKELEDFLRGDE